MASTSTPSTDGPVTLFFHDITRVAGETITGQVDLNVAHAQEDNLEHLQIRLKGTIHCKITTRNGDTFIDHKQTIILFNTKVSLWDRGAAFPAPGSHILPCTFQFLLPETLPPSFHCDGYHRKATISYALEVEGKRDGFYRINRRIRRLISVVPAASQEQLLARESLRQGWNGPWRSFTQEEKLRKGIWGEYSRAYVKLRTADMAAYPIATAIPFSFHVETYTKPMHKSDAPVDKHGKPLFPALPALSSDVKFTLLRRTEIRVRSHKRHLEDKFPLKGGLGDAARVAVVQQVNDEPEWIPASGPKDKKNHGIWKRAVHFHSAVAIPYAPTSSTEIVDWQYNLLFEVPFPGVGNDLRLLVPVHLHPGSACPPPLLGVAESSNTTYADILPAGLLPPMVDLPPYAYTSNPKLMFDFHFRSYWTGEHHTWDVDEKK
ncbi:hypothetical protein DFH08DRAFT_862029 [Mycena albidolilacea]|uniref:Arrestin-like N-terminal domain-containing protein n=1 Tax=Mycena albidolilacea TaxID=1033008 RepID=A0AAD7EUY6_9AGAR|nr:hypothetical protein DFH08DRAFT_862029 [Mycena albidolilacea]